MIIATWIIIVAILLCLFTDSYCRRSQEIRHSRLSARVDGIASETTSHFNDTNSAVNASGKVIVTNRQRIERLEAMACGEPGKAKGSRWFDVTDGMNYG